MTTYKSLQPFVSTTLLSRLIGKKIWEVKPLWEGFIRLVKAIAPNSFAALLQLPREQLREVVHKQPSLRDPLRDYVSKSEWRPPAAGKLASLTVHLHRAAEGGANNARTAAVLEVLDDTGGSLPDAGSRSLSGTPGLA